ncbi:LLM class F420-dependent oxidoreductase [Kibdelosporangium aridum]|uniref:LLM class F420-dependent oxidoreductase n=1 Tax=Kibdelosporangium aridum TaxID=2030 RepID=UPI000524E6AF
MTVKLGKFGIWQPGFLTTPAFAREIENLGFTALWLTGVQPALDGVEDLLATTTSLTVGTSVLNVWQGSAATAATSFHRINDRFPGRFLLGIGAGHPELNKEFDTPMQALTRYLDDLDAAGVPVDGRAIAALGPNMLALAAERSTGALPYSVTPEHTRRARATLGKDRILAPEHKVVLDTDPIRARETNRDYIESMLALRHYRNSLRRLGFTETDVSGRGSDRLIDALVAHGDIKTVASKISAHLEAGADHVALQVMTTNRVTPPGYPPHITVETYDDRMLGLYRALAEQLLG